MSVFQNAHIFMMVVSFGTETTQFLCTNIVKLNLTLPLTFCTVTMRSHENILKIGLVNYVIYISSSGLVLENLCRDLSSILKAYLSPKDQRKSFVLFSNYYKVVINILFTGWRCYSVVTDPHNHS